ncbi:unnamed protein product [Ectocarpus sp. CCAP 1310/34]|nr:unnamed protein product [Ectocarpus sp. CCAP 1310/34]
MAVLFKAIHYEAITFGLSDLNSALLQTKPLLFRFLHNSPRPAPHRAWGRPRFRTWI